MPGWQHLRDDMVERQLRRRGVRDERVIEAMRRVPRHEFIPGVSEELAYSDQPQPIGAGQTISQPYIVAVMAEALELRGTERVLDVGSGCGYHAAVLAEMAAEVFSIERDPALAWLARHNLGRLGYSRVTVIEGDGSLGYPEAAPYHAISVAAAAPDVPARLLEQLDDENGHLVIPVGSREDQQLRLVRKVGGHLFTRVLTHCRFVPLRGAMAWKVD